jgi:hypothetical protein
MKKLIVLSLILIGCGEAEEVVDYLKEPAKEPAIEEPVDDPDATVLPPQLVTSGPFGVGLTSMPAAPESAQLAMDGNPNSFWYSNNVGLGEQYQITINLGSVQNHNGLTLINNYSNSYAYGDMAIFTSEDGTSWSLYSSGSIETYAHFDGDITLLSPFTAQYVAIVMRYNGTGGFGGTPAFYISEVQLN